MGPNLELSPEAKDQWAKSQGTQEFAKQLQTTIEEAKERWASGHFEGETAEATVRLNAQALAGVDMLRQMLDVIDEWKIQPVIETEPDDGSD